MFSFISGFAVFASLGYLANIEGVAVKDLPFAGFSLVFGTWPVVMGTLPGGIHWVRLLFFDLFLLGIDSGFGLLEGSLTAAADTVYLCKYSKATLAAMMSFIGFLFSIIYCTDAGLNFLDVVDFYINFVMLLVGFFETFAAGWIFGLEEQVAEFGKGPVYAYFAANFGSVIIACGLWFGIGNDVSNFVLINILSRCILCAHTLRVVSTECNLGRISRSVLVLLCWYWSYCILAQEEDGRRAWQVDLG